MEFRKTDMPSFVAGLKAGQRGNGAAGLHVVPAVERTMLHTALAKIDELETQLEALRNEARSAARRSGMKLSGLFSTSRFIRRESGERWASEALQEGKDQRTREIIDALHAGKNPDPRLRAWADGMLRLRRDAGISDDVTLTLDQYCALTSGELEAANDDAEIAAKARAAEIIAAGERARSDGSHERPQPTGLAKKILDAAKKAHRKADR